eukprot:CAMPEP_0196654190 /NCGR_PEP_ID=MMETSP1086-20130531/3874_1 /TAXON_ID=77921 /ORGANISM="Cyanoptyche  gloeocystis , Strain SAG4.97" /LENGTH=478 /DNA_ID=CAMNT_0041985801 /DNA_START=58 /DNA_END=1494 /DNA_ORIENTATION=+
MTDIVPVITADGQISGNEQLKSIQDAIGDRQFSVLAILGPQGSGKSTLLNDVFHTQFPVLEPSKSRTQTTKGIAATAVSADSKALLLLDVEGTDSRERGEKSKAFEKKVAVFSLQAADVLIVNTWFHDVGRAETATSAILRTIFDESLKLASGGDTWKTYLLIAVRDTEDDISEDDLKATVLDDVQAVWSEAAKSGRSLSDLFKIDVVALPHYRYSKAAFDAKVEYLNKRLAHPDAPDTAFDVSFSKNIPADLPNHLWKLWDSVKGIADVSLPPQKELAAAYKCDEVYSDLYNKFLSDVKPWKTAGFVENFGRRALELINSHLEKFDGETAAFKSSAIAQRKKGELKQAMLCELQTIFVRIIPRIRAGAVQKFKQGLSRTFEDVDDFQELADREAKTQELFFIQRANQCVVPGAPWSYQSERMELQTAMQEYTDEKKTAITQIQRIHAQQQHAAASQPKMTNFNFSFGFNFQFGPGGY